MTYSPLFFLNSILFGIGLAMDSFSVSIANGLNEPHMKPAKACAVAGTFGIFQWGMPLVGWFCVHTIMELFLSFQKFIPWIALILLLYIGGKMLIEGFRYKEGNPEKPAVGFWGLMVQGIATAIDALSVGFTIADYAFTMALVECVIIGIITFLISLAGLKLGKKLGMRFTGKASILGGVILIFIGIEIFLKNIL